MTTDVIRSFFYLVLGLVYIAAGVFIWWRKVLPEPWGIVLMIVFVLYGGWRIARGFRGKT